MVQSLDGCVALGGLVRAPGFQEGRGGDAEEARLLRGLRGLRGPTIEEWRRGRGRNTFLRGKIFIWVIFVCIVFVYLKSGMHFSKKASTEAEILTP